LIVSWKNSVLFLFSLSILLPQGVGVKLLTGLPGVDLPRLVIFCLWILFFVYCGVKYNSISHFFNKQPKTIFYILLLIVLQFLSVLTSESPAGSLLWAVGNLVLVFGFAGIVIFILYHEGISIEEFCRCMSIIATVLLAWTFIEIILQENIITHRGAYRKYVVDMYLNINRLWIMPIGPYVVVKPLAAALLLFSPLIYLDKIIKGKKSALLWGLLFIVGVISTQTIGAIIALFIVLVFFVIFFKRKIGLLLLGVMISLTFLILVFFPEGEKYFTTYLTEGRGSFGARFANNLFLLEKLFSVERVLLGFGPGSLSDFARVPTSIYNGGWENRTDPGSIFIWFIETGVIAGSLIVFILIKAVVHGCLSNNMSVKFLTFGLVGFSVLALSSQSPVLWGPAFVYIGMIEMFYKSSNKQRI
jgi:hypothetical protein